MPPSSFEARKKLAPQDDGDLRKAWRSVVMNPRFRGALASSIDVMAGLGPAIPIH